MANMMFKDIKKKNPDARFQNYFRFLKRAYNKGAIKI